MPPMPYPVSRNLSVIAVERLLNSPGSVRAELYTALERASYSAEPFLGAVMESMSGDGRAALEVALATVGKAYRDDPEMIEFDPPPDDANDVAVGLHHFDAHWFSPQRVDGFWWNYEGNPTAILVKGILKAIELAGIELAGTLPIHLTWVCSSPTFEVSVAPVATNPPAAIVVTVSTPGTRFSLRHLSETAKALTAPMVAGNHGPEAQYLVIQRARRTPVVVQNGDLVVIDGDLVGPPISRDPES